MNQEIKYLPLYQWTAFPFVAALIFVPWVGIFFISEVKSRTECAEYLAREASNLRKVSEDKASSRRTDSF